MAEAALRSFDARQMQALVSRLGIRMPEQIPNLGSLSEARLFGRFTGPFLRRIPKAEQEEPLVKYARTVGQTGVALTLTNGDPHPDGRTRRDQRLEITGRVKDPASARLAVGSVIFETVESRYPHRLQMGTPQRIGLIFAAPANLDPSFQLLGGEIDDLRAVDPRAQSLHSVEERIPGDIMDVRLKAMFGISVPVLEAMRAVELERVEPAA